ncbi:MAG: TlyA family RNA methyltransferase [Acholeplasmataceae bacterium]
MRLDQYLVDKGLVETRSKATDLIKRGYVLVDEITASKAGLMIIDQEVKVLDHLHFVGRAGEKLYHAIKKFNLDFSDKTIIDIGASTGGFTECSLEHGAKLVYTYDVGRDQLAEKLKTDERVICHEETNILDVKLPDADVILIDVSFISITKVFKHIQGFQGEIIGLIKPQFEIGKKSIKQGIVKDIKLHKVVLNDVLSVIESLGFNIINLDKSEIKGKKGNQEYIIYIDSHKQSKDILTLIGAVL